MMYMYMYVCVHTQYMTCGCDQQTLLRTIQEAVYYYYMHVYMYMYVNSNE